MTHMERTRNFCIIAHIDHGKSTLADRLIQLCGAIEDRKFRDQLLDSMDIERERGITIKSQAVSLAYTAEDGKDYRLNLIDTPGHVDFSHEVRRSLMSCEGALILVDAAQGVEAQTVANLYLALEHELELIPVINKIDLPAADIERAQEAIDAELGLDPFEALPISARTGENVETILEAIVKRLPAPEGDPEAPLKALIFDAYYDRYRGVVLMCRIMDGRLKPKDTIRFMHTGVEYLVEEIGLNHATNMSKKDELSAGDVGYVIAGIKAIQDIDIGDTITHIERPAQEPVEGYTPAKPVVFSSIYPMSTDDYPDLVKALEKLSINDAALVYQKDSSVALGFGFRCGFLGLLHLDVIQERLNREFDMSLILSAPSVLYKVKLKDGTDVEVDNPYYWPDPAEIDWIEEPYIKASIIIPERFLGAAMTLCRDNRASSMTTNFLSVGRMEVIAEMPLGEVLFEFYDKLKTVTRGYGSFDYEELDYRRSDIVKVDILVNKDRIDALAFLAHRDKARYRALHYCEQLSKNIPRQQFKIPIQGAIGGKIIARETINALRKNVTAKCYGGDISRKRKLLEKQKAGKKKMRMFGTVQIPQEAFIAVLRTDDE